MAERIGLACLWLGSLLLAGLGGWAWRDLTPAAAAPATSVARAPARASAGVAAEPLPDAAERPARQRGAEAPSAGAPRDVAADRSSLVAATCIEAPPPGAHRGAQRLLQGLREGDEEARRDALLRARGSGLPIPDEMVSVLLQSDSSEQVRLLAFDRYMESRSGSEAEARAALEAALHIPSSAVQVEARRRLDQLDEFLRIDLASSQLTPPER